MAFKVLINGITVICDTPEDVHALTKSSPGRAKDGKEANSRFEEVDTGETTTRWTQERFNEFMGSVKKAQKIFIETLINNPGGRTDAQIMSALGIKSGKGLGGLLGSLNRNALSAGVSVNDIYIKERVDINGASVNEYKASPLFKTAHAKYGKS